MYSNHSPYTGICSKCSKLLELDTSTALCEKCSPTPKPKKEDSDGS